MCQFLVPILRFATAGRWLLQGARRAGGGWAPEGDGSVSPEVSIQVGLGYGGSIHLSKKIESDLSCAYQSI